MINLRTLIIFILLTPLLALAQLSNRDKQDVVVRQLLQNAGAEQSTAKWTASAGTFVHTTTSSQVSSGAGALSWDAGAASQTLTSDAVAIPAGFYGNVGIATCMFKGASAFTHKLQVYDGTNVVAEDSITSSTDKFQRTSVYFSFPSSGNIQLRIEAQADEPALYIDDCYLGLAEGAGMSEVSQAEFYGAAIWPGTTNCIWTSTSNQSFANYAADADCTTPAGSNLKGKATAPATKVPGLTFPTIEPGVYMIEATGTFLNTTAAQRCGWRFSDGTNNTTAQGSGTNLSGDIYVPNISGILIYNTAQTNVTIQIQGTGLDALTTCNVQAGTSLRDLQISVYKFPLNSQTAFNFDSVNWKVDANIGGANPALSINSVTTYTEITDAGLTLTDNASSKGTASGSWIGCSSTNTATGTTCSVGNEGIAVYTPAIPKAGVYMACFDFTHFMNSSAGANITYFQIVETADGSQTILQEGGTRVGSGNTSIATYSPHKVCGTFKFDSVGRKMLRLMYEQFETTTITASSIVADESATQGQRDIHFTMWPLDLQYPAPVINNSVTTTNNDIARIISASFGTTNAGTVCSANPCTLFGEVGGAITLDRDGAGDYSINIASGTFSSAPACSITVNEGRDAGIDAAPTATQVDFKCRGNASATDADCYGNIVCVGLK